MSLDYEEVKTVIKDFIKTYVENSGCNGLVLGLSGGIDSAVTAIICKQTLGKNNVKCVFLPDKTTPQLDIKHQKEIVKKYDLLCETKDISQLVENIRNSCIEKPSRMAIANIKARARMILLFEYANTNNCLVCGTSNKSEILLGYFTKYGDGGVDIMPIGDLYKTQVYELALHLGIKKAIIKKPPTAGLLKGQTDEKELKLTYDKIDKILLGLEKKMSYSDISNFADVSLSDVKRIRKMRAQSQHKRDVAIIPKIGIRTSGLDWRSPILEG